jgi:hypothetical protein
MSRATFQNIASRLRETPTFEKTRVSPRQNPYFRSGRPSLSPAQAQRAKKKLQNASVSFSFFLASQDVQAATGSDGPPWAPNNCKKQRFAMFFEYSATTIKKTLCFFHVFGACEQSPPSPNKHKVQPPTAGRQPPTGSRQPPAASRQPPAANRQPPAASRQPPATVAANLSVYASWPPTCLCTPAGPTSRQPPILVSTYKTEAAIYL